MWASWPVSAKFLIDTCLTASPGAGGGRAAALPGLQDVRGQWKGSWEAYGGGGGATSVEFGVRGEDWEWGDYGLDKVPQPRGVLLLSICC